MCQSFSVKSIGYDDDGNINHLVITDKNGKVRYSMGNAVQQSKPAAKDERYEKALAGILAMIPACNTLEELKGILESNPQFNYDSRVRDALNARYTEIKTAA